MTLFRPSALLAVFVLAACTGEKDPNATDKTAGPAITAADTNPDAYRQKQQAYADSVLNKASSAKQLVDKLGKDYEVGSTRLRDTLALLSSKTDCHEQGRKSDPYLAGTVSWYVFMSVVGSNVVRLQESQWSSAAGKAVDMCLNEAATKWKFDTSFGPPKQLIAQVQFKPAAAPNPDSLPAKKTP
jgi:hypothetical protein